MATEDMGSNEDGDDVVGTVDPKAGEVLGMEPRIRLQPPEEL